MKQLTAISTPDSLETPWRSLHVFNMYRLIIAGVIAIIFFFTKTGDTTFGLSSAKIFTLTIIPWLLIILASGFASRLRWGHFKWQVGITILLDIGFITLLMYASGGTASGLGALILVTIAASGILISGRMTLAFAALATLALLFMHSYGILLGGTPTTTGYTRIGLLGVGLFAVALLTHALATRVRESEALASRRGKELSDMAQINELIIQQMDMGILVISRKNEILMQNDAAQRLLGSSESLYGRNLSGISGTLVEQLRLWQESPGSELRPFRSESGGEEILATFTQIGDKSAHITALFLESTAQMTHQAQQIKLASLGRLTASIAHEIRNPLSAISHAGQLLHESDMASTEDHRLSEIIIQQGKRLNMIVENVLSLSRKREFKPEKINLTDWLKNFHESFLKERQLAPGVFQLELPEEQLHVYMDTTHLGQILCNLCENGMRYASKTQSGPMLRIACTYREEPNEVNIDITDNGPGIKKEFHERLFEPFFTTESTGTGLGLFIARELSELNHAYLHYIDGPEAGAHFRVSFSRKSGQPT